MVPPSEPAVRSPWSVDWRRLRLIDRRCLRSIDWPRLRRRAVGALRFATVVVLGCALGAALAPATTAEVGPLQVEVRVRASLSPGVHLLLPPVGRVDFLTHLTPVAVDAQITEVDLDGARRLVSSPAGLRALELGAPDTLRQATVQAAAMTAGCALAGASGLSLLVYRRRWRRTAQVAATVVGVLVATTGTTLATFDTDRLAQPQFTGLLSRAPYVAGQARSLLARFESYRSGLADIVEGVTSLYATSDRLPFIADPAGEDLVAVLHVSDIHDNPLAFDLMARLIKQFKIDFVIDTGDVTTWGTTVESRSLARISGLGVPYVFVRGNHDSAGTAAAVAANSHAIVLDGTAVAVDGLVIAGIGDPRFTPDQGAGQALTSSTSADPQVLAGQRLADVIHGWNAAHPGRGVDIAAMHEPAGTGPLLGQVPLVLAGHLHRRDVRLDASGTRVMVEGSTGGAGITSGAVARLSDGDPLPLDATVLYLARRGPRAGQLVAYDEVTVGGFGLASVTLQRTVIRASTPVAPPSTPSSPTQPPSTPSSPTPLSPTLLSPTLPSPTLPSPPR